MARRTPPLSGASLETALTDEKLADLLEDIEQEAAPERLLKLARELQQQLVLRKQRLTPN